MDRETIYTSLSPNKLLSLTVYGPSADAQAFYAQIRYEKSNEFFGFSFGYRAAPEKLQVRWHLPTEVCGLLIAQQYYGLFYYGSKRRRKPRYRTRLSSKRPFSPDAIADYGREDLIQYQSWEGVYPIPDLREGKCSWCKENKVSLWVVVFEGVLETAELQSEVVCSQCVKAAPDFIKMRKEGYSRRSVLKDFGFRR